MSTIEEISNQITGIITEQGGQASAVATVKQTLEELHQEHCERFGPGGITEGLIAMCIEQAKAISGLIAACTVEIESLQEQVAACGGNG